jgi:hypothetical protein
MAFTEKCDKLLYSITINFHTHSIYIYIYIYVYTQQNYPQQLAPMTMIQLSKNNEIKKTVIPGEVFYCYCTT